MDTFYRSMFSAYPARSLWIAFVKVFMVLMAGLSLSPIPVIAHTSTLMQGFMPRNPLAPSFTIAGTVSDSLAIGPVGTYINVHASNGWTPNVSLLFSTVPNGTDCQSGQAVPFPTKDTRVNASGGFDLIFQWPNSANAAKPYIICASDGTNTAASSNFFTVITGSPDSPSNSPLISVNIKNGAIVKTGDQVTLTGANWLFPTGTSVTLIMQSPNATLQEDPGVELGKALSNNKGNFTTTVQIPSGEEGDRVILAIAGQPYGSGDKNYYPLMYADNSHKFHIDVVAPTPTPAPTPAATPTPITTKSTGSTTPPSDFNGTTLILILGLTAIVLLVASIVVAVLALRGRNAQPPQGPQGPQGPWDGSPYGPGSGPYNNQGQYGYDVGQNWDETQSGPPPGWGGWQQPGQPWSGRESRPYRYPQAPSSGSGPFDEDAYEDPFRTRMGDPPPISRPNPPPSRNPWDDAGGTNPGGQRPF
jgi:hypothetical protein